MFVKHDRVVNQKPARQHASSLLFLLSDALEAELHVGVFIAYFYHCISDKFDEHLRPELLQRLIFHIDVSCFFH